MVAKSGRLFVISQGGTAIAGMRENSFSLDGSPVDTTDKQSAGFRELADFHGTKSFELTGSGIMKSPTFARSILTPNASLLLDDITVTFSDGDEIAGDMYVASFERSGSHEGEETYTVTLQSSGAWTYTEAV